MTIGKLKEGEVYFGQGAFLNLISDSNSID